MTARILTQTELKSLLDYNPLTGIFIWKRRDQTMFGSFPAFMSWDSRMPGKEAGTVNRLGYRQICIYNRPYRAHRLAFLYVFGYIPELVMHDDQDRLNNRISNLQAGTPSENSKNLKMPSDNTSGCVGVYWEKDRELWMASIFVNGKKKNLGRFKDKELAIKERKEAEIKYKFHKLHGRKAA